MLSGDHSMVSEASPPNPSCAACSKRNSWRLSAMTTLAAKSQTSLTEASRRNLKIPFSSLAPFSRGVTSAWAFLQQGGAKIPRRREPENSRDLRTPEPENPRTREPEKTIVLFTYSRNIINTPKPSVCTSIEIPLYPFGTTSPHLSPSHISSVDTDDRALNQGPLT